MREINRAYRIEPLTDEEKEVCRKAITLLSRDKGWCKTEFLIKAEDKVISCNVVYAIYSSSGNSKTYFSILKKIDVGMPLEKWNNVKSRTKKEVLTLLNKAILGEKEPI